jgi:hypothetical protein
MSQEFLESKDVAELESLVQLAGNNNPELNNDNRFIENSGNNQYGAHNYAGQGGQLTQNVGVGVELGQPLGLPSTA